MAVDDATSVVIVGAGPRALSLLERLSASATEILGDGPVTVHVVDPFAPGAGRIWRSEQSPLLWMNSVCEDVTVFTDASVPMEGPVRGGPSLWEWVRDHARELPSDHPAAVEAAAATPRSFLSRRLQSEYLAWVFDRVLTSVPSSLDVRLHRAKAVDVRRSRSGSGEEVVLDDGTVLEAEIVVLAQGHLDVEPTPDEVRIRELARRHGLAFVGTGYTADLDLSAVAPGEDVIVRGCGLAFIDLVVLLAEGRGGAFDDSTGTLRYLPSGREPHLLVGSRRGVPYRSKLGYAAPGPVPALPRHLTPDGVRARTGGGPVSSFQDQVWPLVAKDLGYAHYSELFRAHPERVTSTWPEFEAVYDASEWGSRELDELVADAVPKAEDRLDLEALDRPLAGLRVDGLDALQQVVRDHVRADLDRRHDSYHSSDAAVFIGLLQSYGALAGLVAEGLLPPRVVVEDIEGRWHNFFSYVASGPPGARLRELVALSEAGIVTFLGADLVVEADEDGGGFRARSSTHPVTVTARAFVDARLPDPSVENGADPLVRALAARGELTDDRTVDDLGTVTSGKVRARPGDQRLIQADGSVSTTRFALGPWVSGGAATAAFARPGVGAGFFRQNDAVARTVLAQLRGGTP
jgi:uncharacterized NAD(P)/FAD-binding protein YdhS